MEEPSREEREKLAKEFFDKKDKRRRIRGIIFWICYLLFFVGIIVFSFFSKDRYKKKWDKVESDGIYCDVCVLDKSSSDGSYDVTFKIMTPDSLKGTVIKSPYVSGDMSFKIEDIVTAKYLNIDGDDFFLIVE